VQIIKSASDKTRDRIKMQASGKLQFGPGEEYNFTAENLCDLGEIGRGAFGAVNKMTFEDKGWSKMSINHLINSEIRLT
jgi:hypothetical protein